MVSRKIILTLAIFGAAGAILAGCRTLYDSPADFRESRKRIEGGQDKEEVAIITRDFKDIPRDYQDEAVATVDAAGGEAGQEGLIALLEHPQVRDAGVRQDIAARLIQRDEDGSAEALLVACQNRPDLVNAEIIEYFGKKQYRPAIALLQKQTGTGQFATESVQALARMEDEGANEFILSLASAGQPEALRMVALQCLAEMKDEALLPRTVSAYETIVRAYATEPRPVTMMAIDGLGRAGDPDSSFEALLDLYENSTDDAMRGSALIAMAHLRGVAPDVIEREYKNAMADVEAEMELLRSRKQSRQPAVAQPEERKVRPAPVRKSARKSRAFGKDYPRRLNRQFESVFGPDLSRSLQSKLNNSLLSYANWSDSDASTRFILRSYRKHYGGDDASARARLKEGLSHPGSLTVILKNVIVEYKDDPMRIYAISQFFSIKRWEAAMLLDMVKANKI